MGRASGAWVAIAAVAAAALAGCSSPPPPVVSVELPFQPLWLASSDRLEEGAYAFRHGGGQVTVRATHLGFGALNVTLFGPEDERLADATVSVTGAGAATLVTAAPAGELVLVLEAADDIPGLPVGGTASMAVSVSVPWSGIALSITSGTDEVVQLRRLAWLSGFAVLAQQTSAVPGAPWDPFPSPRTLPVNLTLDTVPLRNLRIQGAGAFERVHVELTTPAGRLATADEPGSPLLAPWTAFGGQQFQPFETTVAPGNASGRHLGGAVSYTSLEGALLLTWSGYSRAGLSGLQVPAQAPPGVSQDFSYGTLGEGPLYVDVNPGASWLRLAESGEGDGLGSPDEAVVQAWDAQGKRIGPIRIPPASQAFVPVRGGGAHVFLVLNGTVELGADRAPSDVDQHRLEPYSTVLPRRGSAIVPSFMHQEQTVDVPGIPFAAAAAFVESDVLPTYCRDDAFVQLLQDGATIGSNLDGGWGWVSTYLSDAPLVLRATTFGDDGCEQPGVEILSFLPP